MCLGGINILEKIVVNRANLETLLNHKNKWFGIKTAGGAVYLSKIDNEGRLEDNHVWTYVDLDVNITFTKKPIFEALSSTRSIEAIVGNEEEFISGFALGKHLIQAYKSKENMPHPNSNGLGSHCPNCKSKEYYSYSKQTTYADEPPETIYKCSECGHTEREGGQ